MADEQVLHFAAAIDEQRIGALLEEFLRLLGFQMVHGEPHYTPQAFDTSRVSLHTAAPAPI